MSIVSEYRAAAGWQNAGDAEGFKLARAYRATRRRLIAKGYDASPARCLAMARADVERGASFYPPSDPGKAGAPGERGGRWIESPESAGFRFVGFADELRRAHYGRPDHSGWYLYPDGDPAELARACIYQLPARGGRPLFVEAIRTGEETRDGWRDMGERGSAYIFPGGLHYGEAGESWHSASDNPAALEAARGADEEARIYAEHEREYQEAYAAGRRCAELSEEASEEHDAARELVAELRQHFNAGGKLGAVMCATLRGAIRQHIRSAAKAAKRAAELREEWNAPAAGYAAPSWQIRKAELAGAFTEGLGE